MNPSAHIPLRPRDFLILVALADSPLHGYGIIKSVADATQDAVPIDPANLYRSLKRLAREDIVVEVDAPADEESGEQRRYFALTPMGRVVVAVEAARLSTVTSLAGVKRLIEEGREALG